MTRTKKYKKNSKQPKKITHKIVHSLNDNISIKYINWNKGNAKLINKIDIFLNIIDRYKPKIIAIQELNYTNDQDIADITIHDYEWEMDNLLISNGHARSALLIHKSIRYTSRKDLETQSEANVWISVSLPAGWKINVQC